MDKLENSLEESQPSSKFLTKLNNFYDRHNCEICLLGGGLSGAITVGTLMYYTHPNNPEMGAAGAVLGLLGGALFGAACYQNKIDNE